MVGGSSPPSRTIPVSQRFSEVFETRETDSRDGACPPCRPSRTMYAGRASGSRRCSPWPCRFSRWGSGGGCRTGWGGPVMRCTPTRGAGDLVQGLQRLAHALSPLHFEVLQGLSAPLRLGMSAAGRAEVETDRLAHLLRTRRQPRPGAGHGGLVYASAARSTTGGESALLRRRCWCGGPVCLLREDGEPRRPYIFWFTCRCCAMSVSETPPAARRRLFALLAPRQCALRTRRTASTAWRRCRSVEPGVGRVVWGSVVVCSGGRPGADRPPVPGGVPARPCGVRGLPDAVELEPVRAACEAAARSDERQLPGLREHAGRARSAPDPVPAARNDFSMNRL